MRKAAIVPNITPEAIALLHELNLDHFLLEKVTAENIAHLRTEFANAKLFGIIPTFREVSTSDEADKLCVGFESNTNIVTTPFLCPTNEETIAEILALTKMYLAAGVDGLVLDSLYYGSAWKKETPELLDACYCPRCLKLFEEYIEEELGTRDLAEVQLLIDGSYYHEWLEFKASHLVNLGKAIKAQIAEIGREVKLSFFAVPWQESEYGNGVKRLLGQDYSKLMTIFDEFMPMLYFTELGKKPEFVKEMVEYYWQVGKPFMPVLKIIPDSNILEEALANAITPPSSGVCLDNLELLLATPQVRESVKKVLNS